MMLPENKPERTPRAAIYMRVSTVYQVDGDSLPMQKQELTAYCRYVLHIEDCVCFEDAGYSGKNTDRPAFQRMMSQIRDGLFTHLVVWKIDRISRNLLDFANMYEELKKMSVVFVSKNEQFDTSNAIGEAMLKIVLVFAELERGMTSERVTATMISRASNGIWNGGRIPYGYAYDRESQSFSLRDDEAPVVRLIFDRYEQEHSVIKVSQSLNAEGYHSRYGNDFSPVSVWTILRSPWYKGTYRYNYYKIPGRKAIKDESEWVIVDDHHPAVVDAERFARIQEMLDKNARYRNQPGQQMSKKNQHVFSGLLWCAGCGSAFHSSPGRLHASGYRPSKYGCPSMRKQTDCGAKYVSDVALGEFLLNYILNIMNAQKDFPAIGSPAELQARLLTGSTFQAVRAIEPDGLNLLYDMLSAYSPADACRQKKPRRKQKADPELKRLRAEKKKQERALERLNHIYLYSDGEMSDREYIVRKRAITDALQEISETLGMVSQEPWSQTMSDEEFLMQAGTFLLNHELQNRRYIYYERLAESVDSAVLKSFFQSVLDSVYLRAGRVETIVFRNGLSHTFLYENSTGGE